MKQLNVNTAAEIAAAIPGILADRAEREDPRDWANINSYRAYVATLRTGTAWAMNDNTVVGLVTGPDADIWSGAVADAIDKATQDYDLPHSHILPSNDGTGYTFRLVCLCGGACTLPAE